LEDIAGITPEVHIEAAEALAEGPADDVVFDAATGRLVLIRNET
jgi:hypothetical protein